MATQTQSLAEKYKDILRKSSTAYNPGAKPTASDVSAQQGLMKAQAADEAAQNQALKEQWYGTETAAETGGNKKSWLQGALHTLGAPLYGIVGGAEAVLGKGTE